MKFPAKIPEFRNESVIRNAGIFIRSRLIAGILFLTPLALTLWILFEIFILTDQPTRLVLQKTVGKIAPGYEVVIIPGIGLIVTLFIIFFAGILAKNVFGKVLLRFFVGLIRAVPFGNSIYTTIHEITHSFLGTKRKALQRAVLVEYPRKDSWVIAFQTAETQNYLIDIIEKNDKNYVNLFVPTTPNPTSGFMIMVPTSSVRDPNITVEEAVKIIMSGGAFDPRNY